MPGGMLSASDGTLAYWQAWVYLGVMFAGSLSMTLYLYHCDPALLERRLRMKERRSTQRAFIMLTLVFFLALFTRPGLDVRFGSACHVTVLAPSVRCRLPPTPATPATVAACVTSPSQ